MVGNSRPQESKTAAQIVWAIRKMIIMIVCAYLAFYLIFNYKVFGSALLCVLEAWSPHVALAAL